MNTYFFVKKRMFICFTGVITCNVVICRWGDVAGKTFILNKCLAYTDLVISIHSAEIGYSPVWSLSCRYQFSRVTCAWRLITNHSAIIKCNGQRSCSISLQDIFSITIQCGRQRYGNVIYIEYNCTGT